MDKDITFTTETEYKGERVTVKVEASFSPAYREQEYPGAHVWYNKASMDIESVILEGTETDIVDELSDLSIKAIEKGGYDVLAGEKPSSEYTEEDRIEDLDAQRFEDMAYGPRDDDF